MKLLLVSLCVFVLVLQAHGSIMDLSKLFKSPQHSSVNDEDPKFKYLGALKDLDSSKIPHQFLDEFSTYIDQLHSDTTIVDPDDNTELSKEIRRELELIREAAMLDDKEKRILPGQSKAIDCGKYGCCADNSKADERRQKGCAAKLCEDVYKTTCKAFTPREKKIKCQRREYKENCPFTCGNCATKSPAAPVKACNRLYPPEMCCWDGSINNGQGCKLCRDRYGHVCKMFKKLQGNTCQVNSWRIRRFFEFCPKTCGLCTAQ